MTAGLVIALIVAIPIILFPAAYVWYINIGGIYQVVKEARRARAAKKLAEETVKA